MAATLNVSTSHAYAGDVTPAEAWQALTQDASAQFVDVRTAPEWSYAGLPDLRPLGKKTHAISYKLYPDMNVNPNFLAQLEAAVPNKSTPLYFLCRGGVRSVDAATLATQAGWQHCYNVLYGYEGAANAAQQRGMVNGWKASQLPWIHP